MQVQEHRRIGASCVSVGTDLSVINALVPILQHQEQPDQLSVMGFGIRIWLLTRIRKVACLGDCQRISDERLVARCCMRNV